MAKLTACPVRPRFPSAPGSPGSPYEANKNSNRMRMAAHFGKEWWPGFNVAVQAPMGLFGVGSGEGVGGGGGCWRQDQRANNAMQCNFQKRKQIYILIIRCRFFIGREHTTLPANNCLQMMVCPCAMPSNCAWLQIIFCSCVNETTIFSFLRSLLRENGRSLRFWRYSFTNKLGDRMIKQLLSREWYKTLPWIHPDHVHHQHQEVQLGPDT